MSIMHYLFYFCVILLNVPFLLCVCRTLFSGVSLKVFFNKKVYWGGLLLGGSCIISSYSLLSSPFLNSILEDVFNLSIDSFLNGMNIFLWYLISWHVQALILIMGLSVKHLSLWGKMQMRAFKILLYCPYLSLLLQAIGFLHILMPSNNARVGISFWIGLSICPVFLFFPLVIIPFGLVPTHILFVLALSCICKERNSREALS